MFKVQFQCAARHNLHIWSSAADGVDDSLCQTEHAVSETLLFAGINHDSIPSDIGCHADNACTFVQVFLNLHGYTYVRLDGTTKPEQRQILMQRYNTNPKLFIFILSTRSGGVGMNLTGADTVIFYDSDWNPAMDAQVGNLPYNYHMHPSPSGHSPAVPFPCSASPNAL